MRDAYTPSDEGFLDWLAGKPVPEPALLEWHDLVRASIARGVRCSRRARVVSEPLAPFIRYEYDITIGTNIAAGRAGALAPATPRVGPVPSGQTTSWVFVTGSFRSAISLATVSSLEHELAG